MPSPLTIDKKQVRATYIATGCLTETARLHGLKPATVRQWAKRQQWETASTALKLIKKAEEIQEIKREKGHRDAVTTCHTSDALSHSNAASCLTELDNLSALEASRKMVDLATAGKTIFGIGNDSDRPTLNVNVLQAGLSDFVLPVTASVV